MLHVLLNLVDDSTINPVLNEIAQEAIAQSEHILYENAKDLALMDPQILCMIDCF